MVKIERLDNNTLEKVKGGEVNPIWIGIAVAAVVIFISGIIDGLTNPEKCNG